MSWLQVVVLAVVQGITEFLPISSSGHLLIPSQITQWPDQGLAFDVAVHLGTLLAVLYYFRHDLRLIIIHWFKFGFTQQQTQHSQTAWAVIIGTVPVVLVGILIKDIVENHLRNIYVIATTTFVFALVLAWADKVAQRSASIRLEQNDKKQSSSSYSLKHAFIIGCSQILALVPGTSRSGITISAALFLGLTRVQAARFSFLLSIPVISAAALLYGVELVTVPSSFLWDQFLLGMFFSAITAYLCIHLFLAWIERIGLMPFVWYRIALAMVLVFFMLA